jgi:sulfur relay (sulfurtransferase) DsrC/TusE family protein
MKIIITESQYHQLFEQPDEIELMRKHNKPASLDNLSFDDVVDVISGLIDGVPGIGNLISAGIDVTHAISYGVRFFYAKDDNEKIEMATLGVVTLGAATLPVAGNALPIMARQGVKSVLRKTPQEILLIGKQLGLYKQTVFLLSKTKWKYNLLLVLAKIFGYELIESLTDVVKYVRDIMSKINNSNIKRVLKSLLNILNEILSDVNSINAAINITKKLK